MSRALRKTRPNRDKLHQLSALWLVRRDFGLTRPQEIAFRKWREASPSHRQAVTRLGAVWRALQRIPRQAWT